MNGRQKRFVEEYLIDLNQTQAAIRAGYPAKVASAQACRLMKTASVAEALRKAQEGRARRLEITQDRVLKELARIGFSDMRRFTKWGPRGVQLLKYEDLTDDEAAAVAEVSQTVTDSGGSIKFKLHDKRAALVDIGKHLGMFTEKVEHSGTIEIGLASRVEQARKRGPKTK